MKVKQVYHVDFLIHKCNVFEVWANIEKFIRKEEVERRGVTMSNYYEDDNMEVLRIDFYLPSMLINKRPKNYLDWAEHINRGFLTEFLCAFVRRDREGIPECQDKLKDNYLNGKLDNCPFVMFTEDF